MTKAQEIAAKLDEEWKQCNFWICHMMTFTGTGLLLEGQLVRRAWLYEARRVAAEEVRKEIGL